MPSSFVHFAVAALVATALGYRGRARAWIGLVAVAPDLDVVTAIPWMIAAPHLPLSADVLTSGAWLFGHRGLSHTVWPAIVAGVAAGWWRSDRRLGWAVGLAWASHTAADVLSPWPTHPLWPVSEVAVSFPLVTTVDPLLTVAAVVATFFVGVDSFDRFSSWLEGERRERLVAVSRRGLRPMCWLVIGAFGLGLALQAAVAVSAPAPLSAVHPTGAPGTATVYQGSSWWTIETRSFPWGAANTTTVPFVTDATGGNATGELVAQAACALSGLGPYSTVEDHLAWTVRDTDEGRVVEVTDALRNVTREGRMALVFAFDDEGRPARAWVQARERGPFGDLRIHVPDAVVRAAACADAPPGPFGSPGSQL